MAIGCEPLKAADHATQPSRDAKGARERCHAGGMVGAEPIHWLAVSPSTGWRGRSMAAASGGQYGQHITWLDIELLQWRQPLPSPDVRVAVLLVQQVTPATTGQTAGEAEWPGLAALGQQREGQG